VKTKLMMFAGALVFLAGVGHFGAKPLMAQIRAALVKNIDEPGRAPYQNSNHCTTSGPINFCGGQFATVPLGKRLVVQHVSISFFCSPACTYSPVLIGIEGQAGADAMAAYVMPVGSQDGSVDQNILLYIEPGNTPIFATNFTSSHSSAKITLTGYLVDLSQ
jgi:hypothetical protein